VKGETATPRRVSAALLDDCDKGTWNLSIYCNIAIGRGQAIDHLCHIARPDIGRGRDALRDALLCDPAWHVQKTCNGNIGLSL